LQNYRPGGPCVAVLETPTVHLLSSCQVPIAVVAALLGA
jgi:hypothetical protein